MEWNTDDTSYEATSADKWQPSIMISISRPALLPTNVTNQSANNATVNL